MNILLLNPPGRNRYQRDYYCSHTSKARYLWYPLDLVMQSGHLAQLGDVTVLDCIAEGIGPEAALLKIKQIAPDLILFLSGIVSHEEDFEFLERVSRITKASFFGSGDIFFEVGREFMDAHEFFTGYLLDFTTDSLARWIKGDRGVLPNLVYRDGSEIMEASRTAQVNGWKAPPARQDLFPMKCYRYPMMRYRPFGVAMSAYGCGFSCRFCQGSSLPFRKRDLDNTLDEIRELWRMGVKEFHLRDLTFAADRSHAVDLLDGMKREGMKFRWHCLSRVDVLDEDLVAMMRESGCATIHFGIETLNPETLRKYKKNFDPAQAEAALQLCHRHRIRTIVSFIYGLPEDTREDLEKIGKFVRSQPLTVTAFNLAVPRPMTDFRRELLRQGKINSSMDFDCSSDAPVVKVESLDINELRRLRKRAIRQTYFRPAYWWNLARTIESFSEVRFMAEDFMAIVLQQVKWLVGGDKKHVD